MKLEQLKGAWDEIGKTDPLWGVLSAPDKRGQRWRIDEFLQTGVADIDALIAQIDPMGIPVRRRRALDFGCGPGRLTQALARHFDRVDGVDISQSMIELARELNRYGDRCQYHVNEMDDLRLFPERTFDLVNSSITLQHMEPSYARRYIAEFIRVLAPDGLAVFQIPSERRGRIRILSRLTPNWLQERYRRVRHPDTMALSVYGVPRREILKLCQERGAEVIRVDDSSDVAGWESLRYFARQRVAGDQTPSLS